MITQLYQFHCPSLLLNIVHTIKKSNFQSYNIQSFYVSNFRNQHSKISKLENIGLDINPEDMKTFLLKLK